MRCRRIRSRRERLGDDPLLGRLVPVDVVDARVAGVARLEALDLDVAVVHQVAARHALDRLPPAAELVALGMGGGGPGEEQERA